MKLSILTCQKKLDHILVERLANSFHKLYPNLYIKIYCIYSVRSESPIELSKNHENSFKIYYISELDFFGVNLYRRLMSFKSLYEVSHAHSFGWFFQQLIKLQAPIILNRGILIFDSDSIPIRQSDTYILPDCLPCHDERFSTYYKLTEFLLGTYSPINTHFIAQHMYFDLDCIQALSKQVLARCSSRDNWLVCLASLCSNNPQYILSEYELYGRYRTIYFGPTCSQEVVLARHATTSFRLLGPSISLAVYRFLGVHILAFENWSKSIHIFEIVFIWVKNIRIRAYK